jgi:HD-GYP domain-containing protein (c-di-GMP phosphodiesterase class II)
MGFNDVECIRMTAAGHMHDMGKLAVSAEALQKRGELNKQQEAAMKRHPYLGYRAMETVPELRQVSRWAFLHHERVDGSGYPFGLSKEELPLGARIMAAADVFGALNEDRPYRNRKSPDEALAILQEEAADGKLDTTVVEAVEGHLDDIAAAVEVAREEASEHYDQVSRVLQSL